MKTLYALIQESRGIVTGPNDWTELCNYIETIDPDSSDFKEDKIDGHLVKQITISQHLPKWLNSIILCSRRS